MSTEIGDPLASAAPLIVYLDIKSPYAYLAKDPTYALAEELGIDVDVRPLTLDIPSYLGSAKADERGKVLESDRSPRQWNAVRYAYRDAKRYARLRGLEVKGTQKIWDTSLASIGMLWARDQGAPVLRAYLDLTYDRFWRRALDVEDPGVVSGVLEEAGAEVGGFADFVAGPGRTAQDALMAALHPSGIFGVPTYVVGGERYFGREQLPVVRWHLAGQSGAAPDIGYESAPSAVLAGALGPASPTDVTVYVDFKNPNAYLAVAPTRRLEAELGARFEWRALHHAPRVKPDPAPDATVAQRHFRTRADYNRMDLERSAVRQGLPLGAVPRDLDTTLAAIGLLWAERRGCAPAYIDAVFEGLWRESLDVTSSERLDALLDDLGAPGFADFVPAGRDEQSAIEERAAEQGIIGTPTYRVGGELFLGREHLPLLSSWLGANTGDG